MHSRCLRALAIVVLLGGVATSAVAQTDFTTYMSLGDSLAAGFESNSLVETHQRTSVPALIARQAGVPSFEQPLISEPGIPAEYELLSLSPVVLLPKPGIGAPLNLGLARPYNNLAVPGSTAIDCLDTVSDQGGMHDLILRGLGTQVQQAQGMRPTFITLWIGNNDVLGAAIAGRAIDGVTLTPTQVFRLYYAAIVSNLASTGAFIVAANLPDVTSIPFVTTLPPVVPGPDGQPVLIEGRTVPLLGVGGILESNARVTLAASSYLAQGIGIPQALGGQARIENGQCLGCLPDEVYLTPSELAFIQDHVRVNNASIREICAAAGIPVVDVNALLTRAAGEGIVVGGVSYTSDFLSGGLFSYDGVHPSDLGYAIVANEWIRAINANGGNLAEVNLRPFMGVSAQSRRQGPVEFSQEAWESLLRLFGRVDAR
jgi:lysophospholipase L1-like esterase